MVQLSVRQVWFCQLADNPKSMQLANIMIANNNRTVVIRRRIRDINYSKKSEIFIIVQINESQKSYRTTFAYFL
jgi:uncharacterized protein (UPF0333 family)